MKVLASLVFCLILCGCGGTERAILRESMDQGTRTIRQQHKEWIQQLGPNGDVLKLPKLTQTQIDQALKTHAAYEELVQRDRVRYGN